MSKATENAEKRKAMEETRKHILRLMLECLAELLEEGELSSEAKFAAVRMLDETRRELGLDHRFC